MMIYNLFGAISFAQHESSGSDMALAHNTSLAEPSSVSFSAPLPDVRVVGLDCESAKHDM